MSNRKERIVAASFNQILNLTTKEHGLVIHRQKISTCKLVGLVKEIKNQPTKFVYTVTDFTGPSLEVEFYKNQSRDISEDEIIKQYTYCRIYGKPQKNSFDNVYVVAFFIEILPNLNDLTIHLLEVIRDSKELKKFKNKFLEKQSNETTSNAIFDNHQKNADSFNDDLDDNNNQLDQFNANKIGGFSELQNLIINLVKENDSNIGISQNEIIEKLASVHEQDIKDTLSFLSNESHIYETKESHYKIDD